MQNPWPSPIVTAFNICAAPESRYTFRTETRAVIACMRQSECAPGAFLDKPRILVTGGAGFIGSHCCVALAASGYIPVVLDNMRNAHHDTLSGIERVTGAKPEFVEGDILDPSVLENAFSGRPIDAVFHLAGLKAVKPSISDPLSFYRNNVAATAALLSEMQRRDVKTLVFSSSAAVYGLPKTVPVRESGPLNPANPYARTKAMAETMLSELHASDPQWRIASLRYFNPAGAHESGLIGENPREYLDNLMPQITAAAGGAGTPVMVYGTDYPTPDGSGVRDFVHVMDVAEGHVAALNHILGHGGNHAVNLGMGRGVSVLEMIGAFSSAAGRAVPHRLAQRRLGDVAELWADVSLARSLFGWQPRRTLDDMCRDAWRWRQTRQGHA